MIEGDLAQTGLAEVLGGTGPGPDTAALLRELSALSADDEPDAPVRTAPRPPVPQRRRGLFGRG